MNRSEAPNRIVRGLDQKPDQVDRRTAREQPGIPQSPKGFALYKD